jgi:NAD(P)-dependent dehydrogenase (short-subunit alcohol dehydrogenase family)
MKIIVFWATGGTGRAVTQVLLAQGHTVTTFARRPSALSDAPGQRIAAGDAITPHRLPVPLSAMTRWSSGWATRKDGVRKTGSGLHNCNDESSLAAPPRAQRGAHQTLASREG